MKTTTAKRIAYAEPGDLMRDYPTAVSKPAAETIDAALRAQDSFNTDTRNVVVNKVTSEWLPNQANITTHATTPFHARTGPLAQTGADLNQLTEPGLYHTAQGNPNAPSAIVRSFDGSLEVITHGTVVVQRLTSISTAVVAGNRTSAGESEGLVFQRARTNGVWRRWQHIGGSTAWHTHGITMDSGWTLKPVITWRLNAGNVEWVGALLNSSASGNTRIGVLHTDLAPDIASIAGSITHMNFPNAARAVNHTIEISAGTTMSSWVQAATSEWRPVNVIYPAKI